MSVTSTAEPGLLGGIAQLTKDLPQTISIILKAGDERAQTQRDALFAFVVRCASAGLLYLSQIALARWMGGHEYGIYVFVWTWVLILGGVSHLGLSLAAIRLVPEYRETSELAQLRGLIRGTRFFAAGLGTAIAGVGMLALWWFGEALSSPFVLPAFIALVCVPMCALTEMQDGIGRGHAWMGAALLPPYILRPLLLLVAMATAHLHGLPMTATTAAWAAIVATWASAMLQTVLINLQLPDDEKHGERTYAFGSWLKTSAPLLAIAVAELVLQNTDVLVVSRYLTPEDVGIYFASAKTMALVMFVHYAVGSAVANRFSTLSARGDRESLKAFVKDAVNWTFWPSLAAAVVILALGKPLLWLFGPGFEAGYPVMFILVAGFLFRASMGPAEFLLNMLGEQVLCASVLVMAALFNIALNFALVPAFGLVGAAAATSLSLMMAALMNYVVVWRRLDLEIAIWKNMSK